MLVGIEVRCTTCGKQKAPRGRSVPDVTYHSYCHGWDYFKHNECPGYNEDPQVGDLFPGESQEDFGYQVSTKGTESV